ncbi:thioredoxin family protein, partial [Yoonia sp.]|uniref:thioredoxin family protein n=1 Tax=Yoonia sp. TaxID=2212373 RepID=UPI0025F375C1
MFLRQILAAAVIVLALPAFAVTLGDDGLHKADWMRDTFKDLREDLEEANSEGKRLLVIIEQRGCIYCTKMHEEVFPDPKIAAALNDQFF